MIKTIICLVASIFLLANFAATTPVAKTATYEVKMTSNGFQPPNLVINKNDTIKFINVDSKDHWPASDLHPTHLIYPEFDPKTGIKAGQSWSFVFDKAGDWNMHDHLYPQFTGTIKASGQNNPAWLSLTTVKAGVSDKFDDLTVLVNKIYYHFFPDQLTQDLAKVDFMKLAYDDSKMSYWIKIIGGDGAMTKLLADAGGGAELDCHQEAHLIGRLSYNISHSNVFHNGSSACHSGYYHGAMEAFLYEQGTDNLAAKIDKLCTQFPTSFTKFECLHGVGHGVMAYLNYNLPWALDLCQELDDDFAKNSCYGGVFMENIITAEGKGASPVDHATTWVNSDPYFPCDQVAQNYPAEYQCYLMQTSRMLDLSGYNFGVVAKECLSAPGNMRETCFQSFGRDASGQMLHNPQKTLALCDLVDPNYTKDCIIGALNVVIDFSGDALTTQGSQFCESVAKPDLKTSCFNTLKGRMTDVFGNNTDKKKISCPIALCGQ